MLEAILGGIARNTDLFLVDWHEGATPVFDSRSGAKFDLNGTGSITNDSTKGLCYTGAGGGVWLQTTGALNIIDMTLPNWELSVEVFPQLSLGEIATCSKKVLNDGWFFGFPAANTGYIEFFWSPTSNSRTSLISNTKLTLGTWTTVRLFRTGTSLKMLFDSTVVASTTLTREFLKSTIPLSIGGWSDSTRSDGRWNGKIGKVRFFVPTS